MVVAERTFEQFRRQRPRGGGHLLQTAVLVGLIGAAFALLALIVTLVPYRGGQRWAWFALWLVPIVFGLVTLRMLSDGYAVGCYYLILTIVAAIGLLLPGTRYLLAESPGVDTSTDPHRA